ncbi:MAG: PIN domain-containing protein [Acidobacteriota bacterium]
MESVYFESSVFIAVLNGEPTGKQIRSLLRELKKNGVRIYTSIITVQEISVLSFRRGTVAADPVSKLSKMARVSGITKEMALTAAKLEAQVKDQGKLPKEEQISENRRRKWDCFHIAAAMCLKCECVYSCDGGFLKRKTQLGIDSLRFSEPIPDAPPLDLEPAKEKRSERTDITSTEIRGSGDGSPEDKAGAQVTEAKPDGKEADGKPEGDKAKAVVAPLPPVGESPEIQPPASAKPAGESDH